jgi:hypothetical protein
MPAPSSPALRAHTHSRTHNHATRLPASSLVVDPSTPLHPSLPPSCASHMPPDFAGAILARLFGPTAPAGPAAGALAAALALPAGDAGGGGAARALRVRRCLQVTKPDG